MKLLQLLQQLILVPDGATWEPYAAEKAWTLPTGEGWRTVYVQTRDALDRTVVVSDTIYLGQNVPLNEIGLGQTAGNRPTVTLYGLDTSGWPEFQLSPGWVMDDSFDTFTLWWGNGQSVNDAAARGGTAFRLEPGAGESFAWVWTTAFIKEQPMVAYFRLKVNDNSAPTEVARISVEGGGVTYGPLSLTGTDFDVAGVYQEFALPFTFHDNPDEVFLTFNFWRSGGAQVYVDGATIFTSGQPVSSPYTWPIPGQNYRGQGIWVRYSDGGQNFSDISLADLGLGRLQTWPASLILLAGLAGAPPANGRYPGAKRRLFYRAVAGAGQCALAGIADGSRPYPGFAGPDRIGDGCLCWRDCGGGGG